MQRIVLYAVLAGCALAMGLGVPAPSTAVAASRAVLLEDLRLEPVDNAIYHQPERPGKVVRVLPWLAEGGGYRLLAVTELGWVYLSGDDPSEWTLVGHILGSEETLAAAP
jgi:hypothetical protein